ncbi:MAG TPA: helix-hairpin-helix domain-containing protein [Candidatus Eremiobacteraceae bacterium]|nr:helix-hairpin-helix domain-containing protein [Candidatus Eremiobacteraceae bacterium]
MERFKPYARWAAVIAGAVALAFAYFAPHRTDSVVVADDSPPPPQAIASAEVAATASPSPGEIAVYVCGAIRHVGVFRLSPGSRVVDAVAQAGGLAGDADPEAINLAEPLVDGMKIDVPKKGARPSTYSFGGGGATYDLASTGASATGSSSHRSTHHRSSGRSGAAKLQPGETVDVNTAGESELERLPGVGPSLARRIIEYREANGLFGTPDDLQNVSGIGPSKYAKMEAFVRV